MLSDIITEHVNREHDLEVVGVVSRLWDLSRDISASDVDVLIVALPDEDAGACEVLLWSHPRLRMLTVTREGRESYLHELRPSKRRLGELSPEGVVAAVRGVRARDVVTPSGPA